MAEWGPVPLGDFFAVIQDDQVANDWSRNPFWRPDFTGLFKGGWAEGWVPGHRESVGMVTPKFIEAMGRRPAAVARGGES